ncbi:MAG: VWA domain-containing protein [Planctomycetota bacterium]|nr:MAG: VWA domain-containing protein [Planctomycetota bacterium]
MKRWLSVSIVLAFTAVTMTLALLTACTTAPRDVSSITAESQELRGQLEQLESARVFGRMAEPPEGIFSYPSDWPALSLQRRGFDESPEIDLEAVLRSSQGGGGGSSPFSAAENHNIQMLGDIPLLAGQSGLLSQMEAIRRTGLVPPDDELLRRLSALEAQMLTKQTAAIPGALPSLEDEIWIIQKPADWDVATAADDTPRSGSLLCGFVPDTPTDQLVPVPLKHTDVRAHIGGMIASTVVTQQFENPYDSKIEAVYVFPLPQNAAVNEFIMTIGERRIRGIIRDKAEAEQMYAEARSQGYVASLLTQERPNVFTQKIANIEPGRSIDVSITYFHTLPYRDGSFEYVFPMVVGPRFNPPPSESVAARSGIGSVVRGEHGTSGQDTEVQYLAPSERSGHDVALTLEIDASVPLGDIACKSHTIAIQRHSDTGATVQLASETTIANKDFVLRFAPRVSEATPGMITWVDPESGVGYFAMLVVPPAELASLPRRPMELVFVVDASGSMSGAPIEQAKDAVRTGLDLLATGDTFQLINFSNTSSQLGTVPIDATPGNAANAKRYLNRLVGSGGTMMLNGIRAALEFPNDGERTRFVCFLTDGFIGNEEEILNEMRPRLNGAHVFSFGVGSAPNRYLIERMAKLGNGAVAYLGLEDDGGDVMAKFFERAARPAMSNLSIEWPALVAAEVYPAKLPDVYVGRPVVITGRFDPATADSPVRLVGLAGDQALNLAVSRTRVEDQALARGLRAVWARQMIAEMMDAAATEPNPTLAVDVRAIALEHSLMSAFTAFIAVDSSRVTEGTTGTTVSMPVHVPDGVKYEATVPSGG